MSSELVSHGRLDTGTNKWLMAGYQRSSQGGTIDWSAYKQEEKEMLAYIQHIFTCERCKAIYRSHNAGFCGYMIGFCDPTQCKYVMMMMIHVRHPSTQFRCVSCTKENLRLNSNALSDTHIQHAWIDDKFRPIHVQADIPRDRKMDRNNETKSDERTVKLYWPEESRERESDVLDKIYGIAESEPKGLQDANALVGNSHIIVFRELRPITELTGKEFLNAWWDAVQCHHVLWEKGVYHHDISPSNIVYYRTENGKVIVVLNNYESSSISHDGPSGAGNERTGNVLFMASALLTNEALEGKVKHLYQHDVESFIWVLAWVCLRYGGENGKLRSLSNPKERPFEQWLKADVYRCREKKLYYIVSGYNRQSMTPSSAYTDIWEGVQCCLDAVASFQVRRFKPELDIDVVFTTWLEEPLRGYL